MQIRKKEDKKRLETMQVTNFLFYAKQGSEGKKTTKGDESDQKNTMN